ncbi:MAG: threonine-phosphate decarboxylase CobD [Gammaproteobacteria bacterium]|nr:threonine-phosphate decarboxylase CobD [Gammaproteobacteria bacterium]
MPEHGGNLDLAIRLYGGVHDDWIDLSTGINPHPYTLPTIPEKAWSCLPTQDEMDSLEKTASLAYCTSGHTVAFSGAQSAIQLVPRLRKPGLVNILSPTYAEHAAAFKMAGWQVQLVSEFEKLMNSDAAVVVNPNNPDGRQYQPGELLELSAHVGLLVVDESFGDPYPELSVAPLVTDQSESIVVLRSFGKFYGLAGLRLGFAVADEPDADELRRLAGPWPVSGPAIAIATTALADRDWRKEALQRLKRDSAQLDRLANLCGLRLVGGTYLFRTYETEGIEDVKERLISERVWARFFEECPKWLRLGLPAKLEYWERVHRALQTI